MSQFDGDTLEGLVRWMESNRAHWMKDKKISEAEARFIWKQSHKVMDHHAKAIRMARAFVNNMCAELGQLGPGGVHV